MPPDELRAILDPPTPHLVALERILGMTDDARLIQAITAYAALCRADERERCAEIAEACTCAAINSSWSAAQRAIAEDIRALA